MIADALIEEVRARADIVEVVGEHVPLKRAGKDFRAHCPFHNEKTPSFYVVPSKGFYKCFGCGESGDVFTFLMKRTGVGFQDAVRQIAARVGVDVPEASAARVADEPHRLLYEAVAFAADHFRQQLWDEPAGEPGRAYLERRGVPRKVAERFGLGYAPEGWHLLRESAKRHGFTDETLLDAGLIKTSERGDEPYDRFRDRLIFPIAEVGGRIIGFGGRAVGRPAEGVPKYLNSPETPIHHKGAVLYGLNWSRTAIRRAGAVLVVEGYMDYLALAASGVEHVVAGMGTALTAEQANRISRYTAKAYLLYDSDVAGLRATFRTADALLRAGVHPLVVTLPTGEDPDSLVRRGGAAAIEPLVQGAVDVLERKLQMLEERGFFTDIDGSRRALDRLLPTVRATLDPKLRDIYVSRVAQRTGVKPETLEQELASGEYVYDDLPVAARGAKPSARGRGRGQRWAGRERRPAGAAGRDRVDAHGSERLLILLMLRDPDRIAQAAAEGIVGEDLVDAENRELFTALLVEGETGGAVGREAALSAAAATRLKELQADRTEITDGDLSFADAVADLKVRRLFLQLDELDLRMTRAEEDEKGMLMLERQTLHGRLRQLGLKASRRHRRYARGAARRSDGRPTTDE